MDHAQETQAKAFYDKSGLASATVLGATLEDVDRYVAKLVAYWPGNSYRIYEPIIGTSVARVIVRAQR